jgi:hypothetical protein
MGNLADKAIRAWEQKQIADIVKERSAKVAHVRHLLAHNLGFVDAVPIIDGVAEVDGLRFTVARWSMKKNPYDMTEVPYEEWKLVVIRVCVNCGRDVMCGPVEGIATLGQLLAATALHTPEQDQAIKAQKAGLS